MNQSISVEAVLRPIEQASGLPNEAYTNDDFLNFERENVLGKSWAGLWFASDLPKKGYVKPINFMGLPLIILRNKSNEIKVFHNVCSHRGMLLVHEEMEVQGALRCQYHSWSYNLDGELKGTPHLGGMASKRPKTLIIATMGLSLFDQPYGWILFSLIYRVMPSHLLNTLNRSLINGRCSSVIPDSTTFELQ